MNNVPDRWLMGCNITEMAYIDLGLDLYITKATLFITHFSTASLDKMMPILQL